MLLFTHKIVCRASKRRVDIMLPYIAEIRLRAIAVCVVATYCVMIMTLFSLCHNDVRVVSLS